MNLEEYCQTVFSLQALKALLNEKAIQPKKQWGQNFLLSQRAIQTILSHIPDTNEILEIGSGLGHLSVHLTNKAKKLHLIELDKELFNVLKSYQAELPSCHFYQQNILHFPIQKFPPVIVGNIPYSYSKEILLHLACGYKQIRSIFLLTQKEFALKIIDTTSHAPVISKLIQSLFHVKIHCVIPPNLFYPRPKCHSTFFELTPHQKESLDVMELLSLMQKFFRSKNQLLQKKIKKLYPSLDSDKISESLHAKEKTRINEVMPEEWIKLFQWISS